MNSQQKGIVVMISLLLAGFVAGQWLPTVWSNIPSGHKKIIENLRLTVTIENTAYPLSAVFIEGNDKEWFGYPLVSVDFTPGEYYIQSAWHYVNNAGDIDALVTIWGPDETGRTYAVEVSRSVGNKLTIEYQ
ncbi:MAG: hypothetical protein GWO08_02960, partial [Gammaproteobacteria bacterium]|nr:hypothetical protein [Gammaproteobacteria bacterium]